MGININLSNSQAKTIGHYGSSMRDIKHRLNIFKDNLNGAWQAQEMLYINNAIENISRHISNLETALESLSNDMAATANEVKQNEDSAVSEMQSLWL